MCPNCRGEHPERVTGTRATKGAIYRRRKCAGCGESFVTREERVEQMPPGLEKKSARGKVATIPFTLGKVWK